jgi:hypothetical protein
LLRIHANSVAVRVDAGRQQHGAVHLNQAGKGLTESTGPLSPSPGDLMTKAW